MLMQLHHQFDNYTNMVAQRDIQVIDGKTSLEEMRAFEQDVTLSHPLPEGAKWMLCNEKSDHFVRAAEP